MVRLILSKQNNIEDQIEIKIDVFDTVTARKWMNLLKQAINNKLILKKHVSHHGWIMDQSRPLKHIVDDLNVRVEQINNFNFAKRAWELQNNKIKKDFNIELDISVEKLLNGKDFDTDIVNRLHDKFVQLEGAKTLDDLDSVAPYFEVATPDIRWHISKVNNLAHELFHWGEEYKRWNKSNWYSPEIHAHFYNTYSEKYTDEDNESFSMRYEFGRVSIADPTVGKLYWDAFNDKDDHISNDELFMPTDLIPDFHLYLGTSASMEQIKIYETVYWKWLHDRGLKDHEPALTRAGKPWVGQIDWTPFGTGVNSQILKKLNGYNNIYAIIVDEHKATYEWTMSQEEIDIQQHA